MINLTQLFKASGVTACTLMALAVQGILVPAAAHGQAMMLEEVVVTARKRTESLQEIPIAVSAFSGNDLQDIGLYDLTDLSRVVPNLIAESGGFSSGTARLFVRGIGGRNAGVNFDSGVAVYQDGVYLSRRDGNLLDNVDIRTVEVLRGPQGTLFGKNATGGAILYSTNRPTDTFEGHAELSLGNHERQRGKFTVNVPLVDERLYSRLSLYSTDRDGFVEDQFGRDLSDEDRYGGQLQLRLLPTDSLVLDLNGQYSKTDQASGGVQCQPATGVPGAGWQAALQDPFIVIPSTGQSILDHCRDAAALDKDEVLSALTGPVKPKYKSEVKSLAGTADWAINDQLELKSITAWRNIDASQQGDIYGIGIPLVNRVNIGFTAAEPRDTDWFSQELQLSGIAAEGAVDYVVGLFYSREETNDGTAVGQSGPFFNALTGTDPNVAYYNTSATELLTDNTSWAAFGQADWAINDHWNLTLGLRYTWEERELERNDFTFDLSTLSSGAPVTNVVGPYYLFPDGADSYNIGHDFVPTGSLDNKIDNDDWNPMASISYSFDGGGRVDGGSAYFTIATGFLSGGLSENVDFDGNIPEFDPEEVINYELGMKIDALDETLRINAAIFYTEYSDRQLTNVVLNPSTGNIAASTVNADESSIAGIELETTWLATENLELSFNYSYSDDEIDKFDDTTLATVGGMPGFDCQTLAGPGGDLDVCQVDRTDERLPNLPEQTFYGAAQYTWVTGMGTVVARLDASYRENTNICFDYHSCQWQGGDGMEYDLFNLGARLTWLSQDDKWRVTAWGNNLTDEQEITGGAPLVSTTETRAAVWSAPLTYGLDVAYTW